MDQLVQQLIDHVFAGRESIDKGELINRANNLGLPRSIKQAFVELPDGQVSRSQVVDRLGGIGGDMGGLEDLGKAI